VFDECEGSSIGAIVVVDMPARNPTSRRGDPRWTEATRRWCERDRAPRARAGNAGALADGVISADCRTARSSTCRPRRIAHDAVTERGPEIVDGTPVVVTMATSRIEAELIVGLLRSHGLRAAVSADDAGGQEPQLQLQGVRVLVARADEDAALQLLATVNDDHALAQERAVEPGDTEASAGS
jgi:hypothetical protein